MRRTIVFGSAVMTILALTFVWPMVGSFSVENRGAGHSTEHAGTDGLGARFSTAHGKARGAMCVAGHCCCTGRAEAETLAANEGAPTLDPKQFVGPVREAYTFAGKNPALLAQLRCYCGCDKAFGHQNLLDCYRGPHGATCEICTQEALLAKALSEQGSPVDQIRNAIRRNFAGDN